MKVLDDPRIGIGEDYFDDDREKTNTGKMVKDAMTQAQRDSLKQAAAAAALR